MGFAAISTPQKSGSNEKLYFSVEILNDYDGYKLFVPRPDTDGYFTVVVAVLNTMSRNKCFYDTKAIIDQITNKNTIFNQMLVHGQLYGEFGHPPHDADISRIEIIDEKSKSHHFRKVWCGEESNEGDIPIYAEIRPCGTEWGHALLDSLLNKWENTAFSLRSLMKTSWDNARNCQYRTIIRLVTFDYVNTPGFLKASLRYAPATEGIIGRELFIDDFFREDGTRIATESFTNDDLIKYFGVCELNVGSIKNGIYLKNTGTYLDAGKQKKSLLHDLLLPKE